MSLILTNTDPRPNKNDQMLSEQVEMIIADDITAAAHEADVNAFLISLRDDPNHVVAIRKIDLQLDTIKNNGNIEAVTLVHYLLIGTIDPPYIP